MKIFLPLPMPYSELKSSIFIESEMLASSQTSGPSQKLALSSLLSSFVFILSFEPENSLW